MSASHLSLALHNDSLAPSADVRRAVLRAWVVFLTLSVTYCYAYAWVVEGTYAATLAEALRCVSYDWLIWVFVSPALIARTHRHGLDINQSWGSLARLLLLTTAIVGGVRISLESIAGELSAIEVALIYLPRYFFIAAFISIGTLLYQRLKRPMSATVVATPVACSAAPTQDAKPDFLIVTKGTSKVVLPIAEVICVSASGSNYLDVYSSTQSYLMRGTIKAMEQRLAEQRFIRVHRSHIVRLDAIDSASRSDMEIRLTNGKKVRLGLSYLQHLPHFTAK